MGTLWAHTGAIACSVNIRGDMVEVIWGRLNTKTTWVCSCLDAIPVYDTFQV